MTHAALWPSWALTVALTLLCASGWTVAGWVEYLPLAASLVLFGLPHGAVDHLVLPRLLGVPPRALAIPAIGAGYLALAGLYLALWYVAAGIAFALFIALTWLHWGQGDLYALLALHQVKHLTSRRRRGLTLLVRGGLPMLVPLLAFPATYRAIADAAIGLFAPSPGRQLGWAFAPPFRLVAGVLFAVAVVAALVLGWRAAGAGGRSGWLADAVEIVALVAYFAVVPPILAVGCYFCLWHSPRHIARLIAIEASAIAPGAGAGRRGGVSRFAREAAPTTLAALLLLGGLALAVPHPPGGLTPLAALYLVLLAALTLPHTLVVIWMDRRQGIWR